MAQQGNAITVGNIEDEAIARRVSISDEIAVPEDTDLTARSASGDVIEAPNGVSRDQAAERDAVRTAG